MIQTAQPSLTNLVTQMKPYLSTRSGLQGKQCVDDETATAVFHLRLSPLPETSFWQTSHDFSVRVGGWRNLRCVLIVI
jgi:hypothetical protein